mmetsp:Transcript_63522/g.75165  ORF Transcript_63522/g.75165 Transcript_63522/m.75165 type:complete len:341 (+) Transcript_63522:85-1107(+)
MTITRQRAIIDIRSLTTIALLVNYLVSAMATNQMKDQPLTRIVDAVAVSLKEINEDIDDIRTWRKEIKGRRKNRMLDDGLKESNVEKRIRTRRAKPCPPGPLGDKCRNGGSSGGNGSDSSSNNDSEGGSDSSSSNTSDAYDVNEYSNNSAYDEGNSSSSGGDTDSSSASSNSSSSANDEGSNGNQDNDSSSGSSQEVQAENENRNQINQATSGNYDTSQSVYTTVNNETSYYDYEEDSSSYESSSPSSPSDNSGRPSLGDMNEIFETNNGWFWGLMASIGTVAVGLIAIVAKAVIGLRQNSDKSLPLTPPRERKSAAIAHHELEDDFGTQYQYQSDCVQV